MMIHDGRYTNDWMINQDLSRRQRHYVEDVSDTHIMRAESRKPEAWRCAVSKFARSEANAPGSVYAIPT